MIVCHLCNKHFSKKCNLYRHLRNIHGETPLLRKDLKCTQCNFTCTSVSELKLHEQTSHSLHDTKLCIYCRKVFHSLKAFNSHLSSVHSLPPVLSSQNERTHRPEISALNGTAESFFLKASPNDYDFLQFMIEQKPIIKEIISESLQTESRKVQFSANLIVEKPAVSIDDDGQEIAIHVNSKLEAVYLADGLSDDAFSRMLDQMLTSLMSFTSHGSGWILQKIIGLNIPLVSHVPIRASSFIALPSSLQSMACLLNIRNRNDNNCFLYCYVAAWHFKFGPSLHDNVSWRLRTSPETYSRSNLLAHQPVGDFEMPMGFNQIPKFERFNNVQVNVFHYRKKTLIPVLISKNRDSRFVIDLLLLTDGQRHHYVLIKDLKVFVNNIRGLSPRSGTVLCRNCFHICSTDEIYQCHVQSCLEHEAATIKMPPPEKSTLCFQNYQAKWFVPFVIYFDFESLIKPEQSCSNNPDGSFSQTIELHEPCGFCVAVVELDNPKPAFMKVERSPKCMQSFAILLQQLAKDIYGKKQLHRVYHGQPPSANDSVCWLCEAPLSTTERVVDHCHSTGKFLGFAHSKCNLKRRTVNYIPVVAHNLSNYDLHHICKNLHFFSEDCRVQVIPLNDEKYVSLSIGVKVDTYIDSRGVEKNVYEYLRFIDSYRFMASSLEKLVSFLPKDSFHLLDLTFSDHSQADCELLYLKFKEEMRGSAIKEFVGLKAKMYSIVYEDKQKMSAKGVCRYAQSSLNHEVYRNVLMTGSLMRSTNIRIGAQKHILRTIRNQKISLSAFDDKRFILEDGITCLPFGHFEIRDLPVFREIVQDDDWGSSQSLETVTNGRNQLASPSWSQIVNDFNVSLPSNVPSLVDLGVSDESDQYMDSEIFSPCLFIFSRRQILVSINAPTLTTNLEM